MSKRSVRSPASASMRSTTDSMESSNSARAKTRCSSRSAGTARLHDLVGSVCFRRELAQARNVRVPLYQRWRRAEALNGCGVELPDRLAHRRIVSVHENLPLADAPSAVPGEMHLAYRLPRNPAQIKIRIEAVIRGADVDVVHVEQESAVGLV